MKISIITATYNSEQTIAHTLESILAQTYTNYEVLVIDGCSKDRTLEITQSYSERFGNKLHIVSEPDNGLYDAMNKGIQMSTGEVIGILNSDDFYTSSDVLQQMVDTLKDESIDAVYGDVHYVAPNDTTKLLRHYSSRPFRPWMMRLGFMPAHPSFYCRRELYLRYGLFDLSYKVAADFEQLLRLIFVHRIRTTYLPLNVVTMRAGGISNSGWRSHVAIMKDHLHALRTNGVWSNVPLLSVRYLYKMGEVLRTRTLRALRIPQDRHQ